MTETPWDVFGYDTLACRLYYAKRWQWCIKHRIPYTSGVWTGGWELWGCDVCEEERWAKWEERDGHNSVGIERQPLK